MIWTIVSVGFLMIFYMIKWETLHTFTLYQFYILVKGQSAAVNSPCQPFPDWWGRSG